MTTACEVILRWRDDRLPEVCGKPANSRYPAHGGGYMHLCDEHGAQHARYSEQIQDFNLSTSAGIDPHD